MHVTNIDGLYNLMDWPCADQQHVVFLQQSGNIECTINEARCYSSYLLHGGLELPCALHFFGDAKVRKILQT